MLPEGVKALLEQLSGDDPGASGMELYLALRGHVDVTQTQVTNWYQRRRRSSNVHAGRNAAVWLDLQGGVQSGGGDEPPTFNLASLGAAPCGVVVVGKPQLWESRQLPSRSFFDGQLARGDDKRVPRLTNLCARALLRHYQVALRWLLNAASLVERMVVDLISVTHQVHAQWYHGG